MGTKLYVGNLSYTTTEEALKDAFESDGRKVKEVSIVIDRDTGRPRGFAFVIMATDEDAAKAISTLDGHELDGRTLRVSEARERERRPGGGGSMGGERSFGGADRAGGGPRGGGGSFGASDRGGNGNRGFGPSDRGGGARAGGERRGRSGGHSGNSRPFDD